MIIKYNYQIALKVAFYILIFLIAFSIISNNKLVSAEYNGDNIIDNGVFLDSTSMSKETIQTFLSDRGSGLATRSFVLNCYGSDSKERQWYSAVGAPCDQNIPASHIIYYAAQIYGVNPKVILATMQKEQSLTTAPNPTDWQINQAMGYGCPTSGQCAGSSNFFYQIDSGTWVLRYHYERANGNMNWWSPSTTWTCGSEKNLYKPNLYPGTDTNFYDTNGTYYRTHRIANAATSAFYCYTPHAYNNPQGLYGRAPYGSTGLYYSGSYNFVYFYELWFGSTRSNVARYNWSFVSQQTFSDSNYSIPFTSRATVRPGEKLYMRIRAKNTGYETWKQSDVRIALSRPITRTSLFYDDSWITNRRPTALKETTLSPGQTGTFDFILEAPNTTGTYTEYFTLVSEGIDWFNDPGQHFRININEPSNPTSEISNTLLPGQYLEPNEYILSKDRNSVLVLQTDGNLVLYRNFKEVWSSETTGTKPRKIVMQTDGNLVLYNDSGNAVWNSQTPFASGSKLALQTDGNLVLYDNSNSAIWATYTMHNPGLLNYVNTSISSTKLYPGQELSTANREYRLKLQTDGNLVLYSTSGAIWNSGTVNESVNFLKVQTDGNLVLYDSNNNPVWYTRTQGNGISYLTTQTDGNLVLYNNQGKATWNSGTAR